MDYKHYTFNGREHDLSQAYELIRKGKWDKMLKWLRKELRCSEQEARTIGNEIKEVWQESRSHQELAAAPGKKKRGVAGIIILILFFCALVGGGTYYAFYKLFFQADQYAMEMQNPDAETAYVGYAGKVYFDDSYTAEDNILERGYDNSKEVLDMMQNSGGQFFYLEDSEDGEGCCLYQTDLETFTNMLNGKELNNINANIGHRVKGFLGMDEYALSGNEMNWFGGRSHIDPEALGLCLGGGTPVNFFQEHELSLTCDKVTPEKIAVYWGMFSSDELEEDAFPSVFAIYSAKVTTDHCVGETMFPPEGETEDMTIKVYADPSSIDCSFNYIYFK